MRTDPHALTSATAANAVTAGLLPFLLGLVVVAVLTGAVWLGIRIRSREPAPRAPGGGQSGGSRGPGA